MDCTHVRSVAMAYVILRPFFSRPY